MRNILLLFVAVFSVMILLCSCKGDKTEKTSSTVNHDTSDYSSDVSEYVSSGETSEKGKTENSSGTVSSEKNNTSAVSASSEKTSAVTSVIKDTSSKDSTSSVNSKYESSPSEPETSSDTNTSSTYVTPEIPIF